MNIPPLTQLHIAASRLDPHFLGNQLATATHVLLIGLLFGAGVPILFTLGLLSFTRAHTDTRNSSTPENASNRAAKNTRIYLPLSYLIFATCISIVGLGLYHIAGKTLYHYLLS